MAESDERARLSTVALVMATVLVLALIGAYLIVRTGAGDSKDTHDSTAVTVGEVSASGAQVLVNGRPDAGDPLEPGDLVTLTASVTTDGTASLWMRTFLDVDAIDPKLARHLSIYVGPIPSAEDLAAATDITDPITFPGYVGTGDRLTLFNLQPFVLDGTAETEAAGIPTYPLAVAVYVDPTTPAALLAGSTGVADSLPMTAIVQSVPYRTHPDVPDGDLWINGPRLALG